jgi:hypothetical protein
MEAPPAGRGADAKKADRRAGETALKEDGRDPIGGFL